MKQKPLGLNNELKAKLDAMLAAIEAGSLLEEEILIEGEEEEDDS